MKAQKLFSLTNFAKFARVSRDTLCHYDRIGLLTPIKRGENSYRYYSSGQLSVINMIRTYQQLGFTLNEIKAIYDQRTPEDMCNMIQNQIYKIDKKIDDWTNARRLSLILHRAIYPALKINERNITVTYLKEEPIILGNQNDYSEGKDEYDALLKFYKMLGNRYPYMDINSPVWAVFSEKRIKQKDWFLPDRYFTYNPKGFEKRPAALYVIGYMRGGYGKCEELYERLIDYVDKQGYEVCGDAYEEYPLNEVCVVNDTNYLIRVMITVREKVNSQKD